VKQPARALVLASELEMQTTVPQRLLLLVRAPFFLALSKNI
jgi:hypothetical protein